MFFFRVLLCSLFLPRSDLNFQQNLIMTMATIKTKIKSNVPNRAPTPRTAHTQGLLNTPSMFPTTHVMLVLLNILSLLHAHSPSVTRSPASHIYEQFTWHLVELSFHTNKVRQLHLLLLPIEYSSEYLTFSQSITHCWTWVTGSAVHPKFNMQGHEFAVGYLLTKSTYLKPVQFLPHSSFW